MKQNRQRGLASGENVAAKEFESVVRTVAPPCASGFESSSASHRNTSLTVLITIVHVCYLTTRVCYSTLSL